ncbi:MAG: alcohol dehydrogenase catalytic domain-containing protein [Bacteroidales bacterium]
MNEQTTSQKLPEQMSAVRQESPGGKLILGSVPVPQPGKGQVLVKMHAAPVNPSDLALLKGGYMERNYPFTPGLEGSGEVVGTGGGMVARLRVGKRVACTPDPKGDGTWAEYMVTAATRTAPLPKGISPEQGSMMLVNPLTAMALMKIAREGHHAALVNNAAASALGKMLIRLARRHRIPLINIVRKEEQVTSLKEMGAGVVINSTGPGFAEELTRHCTELRATLFLDAVGGEHTARLLEAAPHGSRVICYARLSGEPLHIDPGVLIQEEKTLEGFLLGHWLDTQSLFAKLRLLGQVRKALPEMLSSPIHHTVAMEQVEQAIADYRENMSAGKVILLLSDPPPPTTKIH